MQYTEKMENVLFQFWDDNDDVTEQIIQVLNDETMFRNFGEGLKEVIRKKIPDLNDVSPKDYLKNINRQSGYPLNRNTVENWFEKNRPKKGDQSREHMYILSFLLGLNVEETCYLFQNVYLDKPFNMRSIKEFIYLYCIKNKLSYEHACSMYDRVNVYEYTETDNTVYTRLIKAEVDQIDEDEKVIEYINSHMHNFQISNVSAKKIKQKLLNEILPNESERIQLKNNSITDKSSFISREIMLCFNSNEIDREGGLLDKYKSLTSVSTMLDIILGINIVKSQNESSGSLFKDANLPQEIMNRFPTKHTFSKDNPSFEELRKMIILLFSYKFWFLKQYGDIESDIDDYQMQLDALLFEANLQPLYYGNPFDWMFLYCSMVNRPLDLFRDIMSEALLFNDVNESYK